MYKHKGVEFFISNNFVIFPLDKLASYAKISAIYRAKKSGSSPVGVSRQKEVIERLSSRHYEIIDFRSIDKKLFVTSRKDLDKQVFDGDEAQFMFSRRGAEYEVRKLSNTKNSNVIFSFTLNEDVLGLTDSEFTNYLRE